MMFYRHLGGLFTCNEGQRDGDFSAVLSLEPDLTGELLRQKQVHMTRTSWEDMIQYLYYVYMYYIPRYKYDALL